MKMFARLGCVVAFGVALSGCTVLSAVSQPAPQLFTLTAPSVETSSTAPSKARVLVDEFVSSASVDTARIVFQPNPNELKYYASARWTDLAPEMIRMLMVQTLESSGRFTSVAARGSEIQGDFFLKGDVRQFAAEKAGDASQVRISLYMRLVSRQTHGVIAAREFSATTPISGSGMIVVVDAYDAALAQVLRDIVDWTDIETGKAPVEAKKPKK